MPPSGECGGATGVRSRCVRPPGLAPRWDLHRPQPFARRSPAPRTSAAIRSCRRDAWLGGCPPLPLPPLLPAASASLLSLPADNLLPSLPPPQQDAMPAGRGPDQAAEEQEADCGVWKLAFAAAVHCRQQRRAGMSVCAARRPSVACLFCTFAGTHSAPSLRSPQICWQMKQLRREVAELLRAGKQGNARIRWVSIALD